MFSALMDFNCAHFSEVLNLSFLHRMDEESNEKNEKVYKNKLQEVYQRKNDRISH